MNILIIGAGIHGCFLSIYLNQYVKNIKITVLEKEKDICKGSSNSTHNRSNRGFHYPRSNLTAKECKIGWDYFYKSYKNLFYDIGFSYYLIEKESLVSYSKYKDFLKKNRYKFKEKFPKNLNFRNNNIVGSFEVFEGCFDHNKLKKYIKSTFSKYKNLKIIKNFEIDKINYKKNNNLNIQSKNKKKIDGEFDAIINCTYDNVNKVDKIFGIETNTHNYKIQNTVIAIIKTKKEIPGFTIMDGKFITILPRAGYKNHYLIYDPVNSVSLKSMDYENVLNRYKKMIVKLNKYIDINFKIKLVDFIYGRRPIPLNNKNDRRSTIIEQKKFHNINYYNIREGKYISAPLIAKKLAKKII